MKEYKLLFTGPTGAGKTTAIAAVSEVPPVITDVLNTDEEVSKEHTTVGLDFGEITLDNGDKLRLFGTPGQKRFSFMWDILGKGAIGLIVLLDNSAPDPVADLKRYMDGFAGLIRETACVIGVGRLEGGSACSMDDFAHTVQGYGIVCPIIPVDVRERAQVLVLIDLLLTQLEHK